MVDDVRAQGVSTDGDPKRGMASTRKSLPAVWSQGGSGMSGSYASGSVSSLLGICILSHWRGSSFPAKQKVRLLFALPLQSVNELGTRRHGCINMHVCYFIAVVDSSVVLLKNWTCWKIRFIYEAKYDIHLPAPEGGACVKSRPCASGQWSITDSHSQPWKLELDLKHSSLELESKTWILSSSKTINTINTYYTTLFLTTSWCYWFYL